MKDKCQHCGMMPCECVVWESDVDPLVSIGEHLRRMEIFTAAALQGLLSANDEYRTDLAGRDAVTYARSACRAFTKYEQEYSRMYQHVLKQARKGKPKGGDL